MGSQWGITPLSLHLLVGQGSWKEAELMIYQGPRDGFGVCSHHWTGDVCWFKTCTGSTHRNTQRIHIHTHLTCLTYCKWCSHQNCGVRLLRSIWDSFWLHPGNILFFCKQQQQELRTEFAFLQICCHQLTIFYHFEVWTFKERGEVETYFPPSWLCKYLFIYVSVCVSENTTNVLRFILDSFFFFTSNVNMRNIPCWNFLEI